MAGLTKALQEMVKNKLHSKKIKRENKCQPNKNNDHCIIYR